MKRLLHIVSFSLLLSLMSGWHVISAQDLVLDSIGYTIHDGYAEVSKYYGRGPAHIVIPDEVSYGGESYEVKTIGAYAFNVGFHSGRIILSIDLPSGLESIGDYAFATCEHLTSINIPDGVTSIGDWAFDYCRNGHFVSAAV